MELKEKVINDVLMGLQPVLQVTQLKMVEDALVSALYCVEVQEMVTELSTDRDLNDYYLQMMEMDLRKMGRSEKTVKQYMGAMHRLIAVVDKNIKEYTTMDIKHYLNVYARDNQASTINNERRFLSAAFTWFRKHKFTEENPVELVENRKEPKKAIDYLTEQEIEILRLSCRTLRERAVMEFMLSTGVRVGEIPAIKISDIDWHSGELEVYANKTREWRTVFLSDVARIHIRKYLNSREDYSPYLFVSVRGEHDVLKESGLELEIRNLGRNSGLDRKIYPHLIRHTFATRLRMRGVKMEDIQALMGHSTPSTTIRYYAATDKRHLRMIFDRCAA